MNNIYTPINAPKSAIETYGRPIWERLFKASVAYKDSVSVDYIRLFGMPTVGDTSLDRSMHDQQIDTFMSINKMVEYFKVGVSVRVLVHSDTQLIYRIISDYLNAWKEQLDRGINVGNAPIDDLVLLDKFAAVVHDHAAQHFTQEYISSAMANHLEGGGKWANRGSLLKSSKVAEPEVQEPYKHQSLSELFSERVVTGGSRWSR